MQRNPARPAAHPSEWLREKTNLALPNSLRDVEKLGHSCGVDGT